MAKKESIAPTKPEMYIYQKKKSKLEMFFTLSSLAIEKSIGFDL